MTHPFPTRRFSDLTTRTYWLPGVVGHELEGAWAPGCRRGARVMVDRETLCARRDAFSPFGSKLSCLHWIMSHRAELNCTLPGATVRAVPLDRWLLGLE